MYFVCMHIYLHVWAWQCMEAKEGTGAPRTGVVDGCECWELNGALPEEHQHFSSPGKAFFEAMTGVSRLGCGRELLRGGIEFGYWL